MSTRDTSTRRTRRPRGTWNRGPETPLTPKERVFVDEYLVDLNGTQAAIRAGYASKSARVTASQLLTKPNIQAAVQQAFAARSARTKVTADDVVTRLAQIGFGDVGRLYVPGTMQLHDITALPPEVRAIIASVEHGYTTSTRGRRGRRRTREPVVKVKTRDAVRALELLGRHLGIFEEGGAAPYTGPAFVLPAGTKVAIR